MSTVPTLLVGLVDDAAVFPPGSASLPDAILAHRGHRESWYAPIVGPLLLPATALAAATGLLGAGEVLVVGVIADVSVGELEALLRGTPPRLAVRQVEIAVAKRGEDPLPGLTELLDIAASMPDLRVYAEIPLAWGLSGALDRLQHARAGGARVAPKFRTGGLAAELFPTPVELAAVICACRDRGLPFKLTAGLHRAVRHQDPETGFTHHGFLNILAGCVDAAEGGDVMAVAERLDSRDAGPLVASLRPHRNQGRPLWTGFGSCSVGEPVDDLVQLGLLTR